MFAIRLTAFVVSLLLLSGAVQEGTGWFLALSVLTGVTLVTWARAPRIYIGAGPWSRWQGRWQE